MRTFAIFNSREEADEFASIVLGSVSVVVNGSENKYRVDYYED